jgi:mannitol/fructose-specific phosphotransferase system IIA component (Ntr-type)
MYGMDVLNASRGVLSQILRSGNIELNLQSQNRDDAFRELISHVPYLRKGPEGAEALLKALIDREKLCSTGLGDGIALPHTRNSIPGLSEHPILVFGRHDQGIDYGAVDGAPVRLLFLLIAPSVSQHLQIMARLTRLLRKPEVRNGLLSAHNRDEVIEALESHPSGA